MNDETPELIYRTKEHKTKFPKDIVVICLKSAPSNSLDGKDYLRVVIYPQGAKDWAEVGGDGAGGNYFPFNRKWVNDFIVKILIFEYFHKSTRR